VLKKPSVWITLGALAIAAFYLRSYWVQNTLYRDLLCQLSKLEEEKIRAIEEHKDLLLQVSSQQDPAWIEMVLMRELGLVPEGQKKIHFQHE